jgi:hypothetical protein
MSSTNRSNARSTHISDYYVTPVDAIKSFLDMLIKTYPELVEVFKCKNGYILDPCAGGDEYHEMSYPVAITDIFPTADICTIDIREDSKAEIKADYLSYSFEGFQKPSIIITNPPFNIAQQIIEKALYDVEDKGYVIMLLRLNFFGSQRRLDFWHKQMPVRAYVHSQRMSFTDNGSTDSIEYMHCIWQKGVYPQFTQLMVI